MKSKYSRPYVVALWNYNDPLISVYVLPYLKIIYELTGTPITLFCFAPSNDNLNKNKIPFYLNIELVPFKKNKIIRSFYSILSILKIIKSPEFKSSDIIHAWCTPAAIIGYYLSIFSGKKFIIDSFFR
jgi:hypothetical protein